ncbi:MAG: type VI secretion system protein TssA, partial [Zymomonas sp.]
ALEVAELLAPVSDENRVGEDLSYDDERVQIEGAFERSVSDEDGESEVDWRGTIKMIEAQSARTKDIWLPIYLMRAGAKSGQLDFVESGALYLGGLLEEYWPDLHPQLDEYGYQGRKGPCEGLTRLGEFIRPLTSIPLLRHPRLGVYSGADFARFEANGSAEDGYGLFRAALEDVGDAGLQEILDKLDNIANGIRRADTVLTENADGDTGTNFQPTYEAIATIRRGVAAFTTATSDEEDAPAVSAVGEPGGAATKSAGFSGGIRNRDDVLKALDAIIEYYRQNEPTSPVPLALTRARDWVTADFLTVLADIAEDSLSEVKRVLLSQRVEE